MAGQREVPFFDLLPTLDGQKEENLWVSRQDQHPNSLACSLIAQAIKDTFKNSRSFIAGMSNQKDFSKKKEYLKIIFNYFFSYSITITHG